jgi:ABC-type dipeptide/oligopeptide/nickel transport system ATPase component
MEPLLRIKDLRVHFSIDGRMLSAVDGVDLEVKGNETVVLAGESGSGKTLTALSIARLLPRSAVMTSGEITLGETRITALSDEELVSVRGKEVSYIFQDPVAYLDPVYTAGDQVAEVIMAHRHVCRADAMKEARRILQLVGLPDPGRVESSYPHQLSGGMNQRVFIAMALASRPKLLVADEPTTALDVTIEAHVLALLMTLKKEFGFSLLFITHNLAIARRIADRVCVMCQGKIVEEGPTEEIFTAPRHEHTKKLIWAYEKIGKI